MSHDDSNSDYGDVNTHRSGPKIVDPSSVKIKEPVKRSTYKSKTPVD